MLFRHWDNRRDMGFWYIYCFLLWEFVKDCYITVKWTTLTFRWCISRIGCLLISNWSDFAMIFYSTQFNWKALVCLDISYDHKMGLDALQRLSSTTTILIFLDLVPARRNIDSWHDKTNFYDVLFSFYFISRKVQEEFDWNTTSLVDDMPILIPLWYWFENVVIKFVALVFAAGMWIM